MVIKIATAGTRKQRYVEGSIRSSWYQSTQSLPVAQTKSVHCTGYCATKYLDSLTKIDTWDEWDPDKDNGLMTSR